MKYKNRKLVNRSSSSRPAWMDRRTVLGVVFGLGVAAMTPVLADLSTTSSAISYTNSASTSASSTSDSSLDQLVANAAQDTMLDSVVNDAAAAQDPSVAASATTLSSDINAAAATCADPTQPGGLAAAQASAQSAAQNMAIAPVDTDPIFDASCFQQFTQLMDLSNAIPSLGSIMASAEQALINFAQKQTCSAIHNATAQALGPINSAISQVNKDLNYNSLNSMANTAIKQGMTGIDPSLANLYAPVKASTATNPFGNLTTSTNIISSSGTTTSSSTSTTSTTSSVPYVNTPLVQNSTVTPSTVASSASSFVQGLYSN